VKGSFRGADIGNIEEDNMPTYHATFLPAARTLSRVRASLREWALDCGFDALDAADIVVAAGEAIDNAIEHGRDELFVVEGRCDDGAITVKVHDQGPSFSIEAKDVRRLPEDLEERGLGIFLMRRLMDDARFEGGADGGTTVTLTKNRHKLAS
jgi:anti-sigma regulatory factor (Ser/Thr protein kinase)